MKKSHEEVHEFLSCDFLFFQMGIYYNFALAG